MNLIQTMDESFNWLYGVTMPFDVATQAISGLHGLGDADLVKIRFLCIADRSQFLHFAGAHQRMIRLFDHAVLS